MIGLAALGSSAISSVGGIFSGRAGADATEAIAEAQALIAKAESRAALGRATQSAGAITVSVLVAGVIGLAAAAYFLSR